jgi:hypothetical protein
VIGHTLEGRDGRDFFLAPQGTFSSHIRSGWTSHSQSVKLKRKHLERGRFASTSPIRYHTRVFKAETTFIFNVNNTKKKPLLRTMLWYQCRRLICLSWSNVMNTKLCPKEHYGFANNFREFKIQISLQDKDKILVKEYSSTKIKF